MMGTVVEVLLRLERLGVQVFLATHDYALLKELDLRKHPNDEVRFHALFRDPETTSISISSCDDYLNINPTMIRDTFYDLLARDTKRALAGGK
jgi:hypothetical protein